MTQDCRVEDDDVAWAVLKAEIQVGEEQIAADELAEDRHPGPAIARIAIVEMSSNLAIDHQAVGEEEKVRRPL